jgi:L-ribulose-5-phosphate 3-epimerase UlaE
MHVIFNTRRPEVSLATGNLSTHQRHGCTVLRQGVFCLSEVPFGAGSPDRRKMVATLRRKDLNMPSLFEMITREPLNAPLFTDQFLQDVPQLPITQMMDTIRKKSSKKPLPTVACIRCARRNPGL